MHQFFHILSKEQQMGQQTNYCIKDKCCTPQYLNNELKIYRWRADVKNNTFIPRVSFRRGKGIKQQQKFYKFIEKSGEKNYLDISRFKKEAIIDSDQDDRELIVFEKYISTLEEIKDVLNLEEVIYVLNAFLMAYEKILEVYKQIIVSSSCCYVTENGEIRIWINYNPKCNFVEKDPDQQIYGNTEITGIINKIIEEVFKSSQKSYFFMKFYTFLRQTVYQIGKVQFKLMREIIYNYCGSNRITSAISIKYSLNKIRQRTLARINQSQNNQQNPSQIYQPFLMVKRKDTMLSTGETQQSYAVVLKTQQSAYKHSQISTRCMNLPKNQQNQPECLYNIETKCSQKVQRLNTQRVCSNRNNDDNRKFKIIKFSNVIQRSSKPITNITNQPNPNKSQKNKTLSKKNSVQDSLKISLSNYSSSQNSVFKDRLLRNKSKFNTNSKTKLQKSEKKNCNYVKKRDQQHFKTCHQMNALQSTIESGYSEKPWFTAKTIFKLVRNKESQNESLALSIGSQSNQSHQSVVVAHMKNFHQRQLSINLDSSEG